MKDFRSIFGVHVLISGRLMAFFAVTGTLSYSTSNDGILWSSPQAVPGNISMSIIMALDVRSDVLTLFTGEPDITRRTFTWAGGWVVGAVDHPYGAVPIPNVGNVGGVMGLDARWRPSLPGYSLSYRGISSGTWLSTAKWGPGGFIPGTTSPINLGGGTTLASSVTGAVREIAGMNYVLGWSHSSAALLLARLADIDEYIDYAFATEVIATMATEAQWDAVVELDGTTLTVVYRIGNSIYATKRTGFDIYSAPVEIARNVSGPFFLVQDPATGYLSVVYQTNANSIDEIYMVSRQGIWGQPVLVAGSDGHAYRDPVGAHDATGGIVHILYTADGTTVEYGPGTLGGKPNPPTLLAPLGTITDSTPDFKSKYNQLMTTDPLAGGEIQVVRLPDGASMWDSGDTALLLEDTPYAGSPLDFDTNYQWRRRDKDTLSNGGTGTFSGWSSYATFLIRQGGTVIIEGINHFGGSTDTRRSPLSMALAAFGVTRSSPISILAFHQFVLSSPVSFRLVGQPQLHSPLSIQLIGTRARSAPTSMALIEQNLTRQTPASISLKSVLVRNSPLSLALTLLGITRTVTSSIALVQTNTAQSPLSISLV